MAIRVIYKKEINDQMVFIHRITKGSHLNKYDYSWLHTTAVINIKKLSNISEYEMPFNPEAAYQYPRFMTVNSSEREVKKWNLMWQ